MDPPNPNNERDDILVDEIDEFHFFDSNDEPDPSKLPESLPDSPFMTTYLWRRSLRRPVSNAEVDNYSLGPSRVVLNNSTDADKKRSLTRDDKKISKANGMAAEKPESSREELCRMPAPRLTELVDNGDSTITTARNDDQVGDSVDSAGETGGASSNLLVFVAGWVIKAIGFEIRLFIMFITLPIVFIYQSCVFIVDPFRTMRKGVRFSLKILFRMWKYVCGYISRSLHGWLKDHKSIWKMALQCGWGLLCSMYVGTVLFGLFLWSFVISGCIMKFLVDEAVQFKEILNFDYTKQSPVAYVPILSCAGVDWEGDCNDNIEVGWIIGSRVIPKNRRSQVSVLLVLPESEYNRNLGIFQVRVEFLSANGKVLASTSHPCMLQFKSELIRLLLTSLKIAPLVTGYVSEAQSHKVRIGSFYEGDVPTSCLRVKIEQRAEFRPGAGIPEIYDASIILESELPFIKRIIWHWKKTIFIWLSITSFMMELLFTLLCCRPIILPRPRQRIASAHGSTRRASLPAQS